VGSASSHGSLRPQVLGEVLAEGAFGLDEQRG